MGQDIYRVKRTNTSATPLSNKSLNKPGALAAVVVLALPLAMTPGAPALAQNADASRTAAGAPSQQLYPFDIPAQPLSQALADLSAVTGLQVLYTEQSAFQHTSPALHGSYSTAEALRYLLAGSGLVMRFTGESSVTLAPASQGGANRLAPITVAANAGRSRQAAGALPAPYAGGQVAQGGSLGLLDTNDVMDTPFSTVNYTSVHIENSQAYTLTNVITHGASVRATTSTEGFSEEFQIRGFSVGTGDMSLNGLYGLLSSAHIPMAMVERVELLKGPGALMRGIPPNGSIGGSANIVTKRAGNRPLTQLTLGYRGDANAMIGADVGRRFGEDKAWGVRFNGVLRDGEATIEDGDQRLGLATLAVDYRGDRLRWSLDAIYQNYDLDTFRGQISFANGINSIPEAPDGDISIYPGTNLSQRDKTLVSRLAYDVTEHITTHVAMGYRDSVMKQAFPMSVDPVTGARQGVGANGDFAVKNSFYDSYSKTFSSNAGVRSEFQTGAVGHRLSLGMSYLTEEAGNAFSPGTAIVSSNLYNPSALPPNAAVRKDMEKSSDTALTSVAISDTLAFLDDRLLLTLGARYQNVNVEGFSTATGQQTSDYDASAVSPGAGVVIKPREDVSLYANYTEGLTRGSIVGPSYANAGEVLEPYKSKQYELGVKVDWGRIITTAAIYQLSHPSGRADANNVYAYSGEQRNRGLELQAYGVLRPGLRVLASASFIQATLQDTGNPLTDGERAAGVPGQRYSVGLNWDLPWMPKLSLSGRVNHTSSMYANDLHTLTLPSVTTLDAGAQYFTSLAGKPVVFRLDVFNLTDENYWLSTNGTFVTNAAGRTVKASVTIDF